MSPEDVQQIRQRYTGWKEGGDALTFEADETVVRLCDAYEASQAALAVADAGWAHESHERQILSSALQHMAYEWWTKVRWPSHVDSPHAVSSHYVAWARQLEYTRWKKEAV